MHDSTRAIEGQMARTPYREHSTPMFLTSSFVYENAEHAAAMFAGEQSGDIYSRFTNPNTSELIQKMCVLEDAEAGVTTASGMAAVFTTLSALLESGDHIVASSALFGNSLYILQHLLPKWGIECTLVEITDQEAWKAAITPATKMVLVETPTNPGLELIDIQWLSELCHQHNVILAVDNCFATPILQKPMQLGADIIIHSATKWIDGQGRVLGGIIVGHQQYIDPIFNFLRRTGACLSPFNAWLLSKSLETLDVRMERHCKNALSIAEYLESHPDIASVTYPHLASHPQYDLAKKQLKAGGGIVTLNIKGGQKEAFQFINALEIPSLTANLGDSRTIVTHPQTTTHSKMTEEERLQIGIGPNTIRISLGLENSEDLIKDFQQALN